MKEGAALIGKYPRARIGPYGAPFYYFLSQDSLSLFHYYKQLAERAFAQLTDEQLLAAPDAESNSVAVIVKHMTGNMLSRQHFLTTDGTSPGAIAIRNSKTLQPRGKRCCAVRKRDGHACSPRLSRSATAISRAPSPSAASRIP